MPPLLATAKGEELPIPIMLLGDAASANSGLARILRDLATRIAIDMKDEFRVATLGYGGTGDASLPFPQYHAHTITDWVIHELPLAWHNFAGNERGILFCLWDCSRLEWLINPPPTLKFAEWLKNPPFDLWVYPAIDAEGPHGKLSQRLQFILSKFDRVLNYTSFSSCVTGYPDHLPHGIDTSVFCPQPNAKQKFRDYGFETLKDDDLLVGIVATNQLRKDWALGIQTVSILRSRHPQLKLWCHTDAPLRHWNIPQLLHDYGLDDIVALTMDNFPDPQMADLYSACDVTLGIGSEGFGYPLAESLACGTPVVHGEYAGGASFIPYSMLVKPVFYRHESVWCWKRPVFEPAQWANKVEEVWGATPSVDALSWDVVWPKWRTWLLKGINK